MVKFSEFAYTRPDMGALERAIADLLRDFQKAPSAAAQMDTIREISRLRNRFETLQRIAYIRHTLDTNDALYKAEQDFFDEADPHYQRHVDEYYRALLGSRFRPELEAKFGKQLFRIAELSVKRFQPGIIGDLQRENRLSTEYTQLKASAQIEFEGEVRNLVQIAPFMQSLDRPMRKRAAEARFGFMAEHEKDFDEIYRQMVDVRTGLARKLGFADFTGVGYARMLRTDYDEAMVAQVRRQVRETIVPIATRWRDRQARRIGVDKLRYYDALQFSTGNPDPKGDPAAIIAAGRRMYEEMSPQTAEFYHFMMDSELLDLETRKGKDTGGYCEFISDHGAPFIFANFNGTAGDVDVLTHEAGHAFQAYSSRHFSLPEYYFPTSEAAEIHSMSMEFFAWPWMEHFFGEETGKYKFQHLGGALNFIPYGVAVDEFQHIVYAQPDLTPAERKTAWRELERRYLPHIDYEDNDYLERGGFWHMQLHIFTYPFYYIDYVLAQLCALQFWARAQDDYAAAWKDYAHLCTLGGSLPFTELVEAAHLQSPFAPGSLAGSVSRAADWLEAVDDTKF